MHLLIEGLLLVKIVPGAQYFQYFRFVDIFLEVENVC